MNPITPLSSLASLFQEWLTSRDTCQIPKATPRTPVPEHRIERRNGVMWSVARCETGSEVWSIVRREAA